MPIPNYDDTLLGRYIRAIENPDSVGFKNGKWSQSTRKGDDPNNRGFGVDIKFNDSARDITKNRPGKWLSEQEERDLRYAHIDYVEGVLRKYAPQILRNPISEEKEAMAAGMLYRGDGIKSILNNPTLKDAFYNGTNEEFQQAVDGFYRSKKLNERANSHTKFMNSTRKQESQDVASLRKKYKGLYNPNEVEIVGHVNSTEPQSLINSIEERQSLINGAFNRAYSEGGKMEHPEWNALSIPEKAAMIKVAVQNGITKLSDIRQKYNEFAKGGDTDWSYNGWKKQISEYMGIKPDEDNTYDYEAFFNKYPEEAWKMLNGDPTAHFSDEFKTVYHPTFSSKSIGNDGSIYSGVRNPKTNPKGLTGGTWSPDYKVFTMSPDGYRGPVSMDDRKWYLENAEDNGVQLREADGSLPVYDGIPWGGVLPNVTVYGNKFVKGGPRKKSSVNSTAQRAMNYFMDKGLSQHQAAGLVGNLMRESSMSPTAVNSGSGAYGLAQWLGPRKKALFAKYGNSPTLDQQLDFVWNELNSTHKRGLKALKNSKTAEEAARNAMGYYEFMAGPNAAIREMKKYGQDGEGSMRKGINYASQLMGASPSRTPISPTTPVNPITPIASQESLESPIPFILANPEAFFGTSITYQQPIIEFPEITQTTSPEVLARQQKEAERQENQAKLQNMMNILGMVYGNSPEDSNNSLISTLGLLTGSTFAKGGKIHIKPENRGKFTALKKRTGHSATWFKEHGTPAQKKMAIFALNARKWKHGLGGNLFDGLTEDSQQMNRLSSISLIDQLEASRWNPVSLKTISENARQQNRGKTNKRLRGNASFTKQGSERMENAMDSYLVKSQREKGSSNSAYDIPFIPEKAIVVDGSITSTNTLDSLAKYAGIHNRNPKLSQKTILKRSNYTAPRAINKDEMLGLSTQETHNGALPYFNYKDNSEYNKILGNSNYFTAFGYLPAENFVRDFHYNKDNIDRNIPPLLDAFQYFAQGDYNRGDAGHTMSVNNAGKRAWQNPKVKQWWEESGKYWYNNGKGKDEE